MNVEYAGGPGILLTSLKKTWRNVCPERLAPKFNAVLKVDSLSGYAAGQIMVSSWLLKIFFACS
jgi:hypothetical protein